MHSLIFFAGLAFLQAATARIVGLAGPSQITPGSTIDVTLITENYIQSVADISAAFALSPNNFPGALGFDFLGDFFIGPSKFLKIPRAGCRSREMCTLSITSPDLEAKTWYSVRH